MTLFGRQVSIAVLWSFIVSAVPLVAGAVQTILSNWHVSPLLALGVAGSAITTVTHTWDTMPSSPVLHVVNNPPAPAVVNAAPVDPAPAA